MMNSFRFIPPERFNASKLLINLQTPLENKESAATTCNKKDTFLSLSSNHVSECERKVSFLPLSLEPNSIELASGSNIVITVDDYKGKSYVDIRRVFRLLDKIEGKPITDSNGCQKFAWSKKGIKLPLDQAKALKETLETISMKLMQTAHP